MQYIRQHRTGAPFCFCFCLFFFTLKCRHLLSKVAYCGLMPVTATLWSGYRRWPEASMYRAATPASASRNRGTPASV